MGFVYYKNHFETRCHIFLPFLFHVVNKIKKNKIRFKGIGSVTNSELWVCFCILICVETRCFSVFSSLMGQDSRPRGLYLLRFRISLFFSLFSLTYLESCRLCMYRETVWNQIMCFSAMAEIPYKSMFNIRLKS